MNSEFSWLNEWTVSFNLFNWVLVFFFQSADALDHRSLFNKLLQSRTWHHFLPPVWLSNQHQPRLLQRRWDIQTRHGEIWARRLPEGGGDGRWTMRGAWDSRREQGAITASASCGYSTAGGGGGGGQTMRGCWQVYVKFISRKTEEINVAQVWFMVRGLSMNYVSDGNINVWVGSLWILL